jgi:hypothetical protein
MLLPGLGPWAAAGLLSTAAVVTGLSALVPAPWKAMLVTLAALITSLAV